MGNTFGQLFRVTTFGESHGGGIGVVIDGCPPKIDISDREHFSKLSSHLECIVTSFAEATASQERLMIAA